MQILIIFINLYSCFFCTEPLHTITVVESGVIRGNFVLIAGKSYVVYTSHLVSFTCEGSD